MTISNEEKEKIRRENPLEVYLPKRGVELRKSGRELAGICPFHQDSSPSLNVNPIKQVWTCRAGCGGGDVFAFVMKLDGLGFMEAAEKLAGKPLRETEASGGEGTSKPQPKPAATKKQPLPPPAATYSYVDAEGKEVFQALRYQLGGGKKTFRQRRRGEDGQWIDNLDGIEKTPVYRLPQVQADSTVWVVEGEKDVEWLEAFGITGTCNPMGAGKWYEHHSKMLAGKEVVLCGDTDEPGIKHMDAVEKSLAAHAKFTKRIRVPSPHKDLSEFLDAAVTPEAG